MSKNMKKGISRRDFLKGTAASALGIAAFGVMGHSEAAAEESTQIAAAKYEVINTDLLIIGGGFGAMSAAYEALAKGQRVTIVDKGPYGHSGNAGFNWDAIATWQTEGNEGAESRLGFVVNQKLYYNAQIASEDPNKNVAQALINRGQVLPSRLEDGSINWYVNSPKTVGVESVFPRMDNDDLARSSLVQVYDRTMVTDVLVNNGRCLGVMGIYLPTGDFRVFRAKATIAATGPATWFYGWNSVSASTIASPDSTGDVEMACYRRGAGIGDNEYACYDFATNYPQGLAYGWNTMLNPDANEYHSIADRDGKHMITEDSGIDLVRITYDRPYFNQEIGKLIDAGRGTDEGGILVNIDGVKLRHNMECNLAIFNDFGVDPTKEHLPAHDEMYEHGGAPVIDENMMTEFEGLFFVRGAGINGAGGGSCLRCNNVFGSYALRCALDYIAKADAPASVDFTPADEEFARIHEIRTRKVENGLRPHEIRHAIQRSCFTCLGTYRKQDKLEACKAELARIRKEDLPRQIVTNPTQTFNNEWKEAIENYNLLDSAELMVEATLLRTETRGQYYRPEYPERDDENWKCMLVASLKDGKTVFEKKQMPEVTDWA